MRKLSRRAVVGARSRGCLLLKGRKATRFPGRDASLVPLRIRLVRCLASARRRDLRLMPEPEGGD